MPIESLPPPIDVNFHRVRVDLADLAEIERHLSRLGDVSVRVARYSADSVSELTGANLVATDDAELQAKGLSLRITRYGTRLTCWSPTSEERDVASRIEDLLLSRRRWQDRYLVGPWEKLAALAFLASAALGILAVSQGNTRAAVLFAILYVGLSTTWISQLSRIPRPPQVILDRERYDARPWWERHSGLIGLTGLVLGAVFFAIQQTG